MAERTNGKKKKVSSSDESAAESDVLQPEADEDIQPDSEDTGAGGDDMIPFDDFKVLVGKSILVPRSWWQGEVGVDCKREWWHGIIKKARCREKN